MSKDELFQWDELEILRSEARDFIREAREKPPDAGLIERFCDYMEFVLCMVYGFGRKDAEAVLGELPDMGGRDLRAVNQKIRGETWRERVAEQVRLLSEDGLVRIIDTEAHRDYNAGVFDAAEEAEDENGVTVVKRWYTMMDDRVRETHQYLEGVTVGLNDLFYTFDGDSALYPGGFTLPENNVNCRCVVQIEVV